MKIEELRIGNILKDNKFEDRHKVLAISGADLRTFNITRNTFENWWYPLKKFCGLPLDTEQLLELGFTFDTDQIIKDIGTMEVNKVRLTVNRKGVMWTLSIEGKVCKVVFYYHQMQNIIDALNY